MENNKGNRLSGGVCRGRCLIALLSLALLFALTVPAAVANGSYLVKEPTQAGTIRGKVRIGKAIPRVKRIAIFKDHDVCGEGHRDIPLVQANGDGLINAVVYLEDISTGKPFPAAAKKITINQLGCRFIPHLSVVANGGEIEVINSDNVLHNIHTYEMLGQVNFSSFNISQPQRGNMVTKQVKLLKGVSLRVLCDAHNFMLGFVFVASNPYYAVVDSDGEFTIKNVPPGNYRIRVWHGVLGQQEAVVTVKPNSATVRDFMY